jgi:polygalacturonase
MEYFDIREAGAVPGSAECQTGSIQKAIDLAAKKHIPVVIAGGTYTTGSLFLPDSTELIIESDGIVRGSAVLGDYTVCQTRFEGRSLVWPIAILNVLNGSHITIRGSGTIDGSGSGYWQTFWKKREEALSEQLPFANSDVPRPRMIYFENCTDVTVDGVQLINAAFWNIHLYKSRNCIIQNVSIKNPHTGTDRAASSDGIDIDASSNVTIRQVHIETDDDCICLKNGKGADAALVNNPTENILIEDCSFGFGHGMVTLGSEAACIRNVTVRNCTVDGENNIVRVKLRDDTEQRFENILFDSITVRNSAWLFDIQLWRSRQDQILASGKSAVISNFVVRNITAENIQSPGIIGGADFNAQILNLQLEAVSVSTRKDGKTKLDRYDVHEETGTVFPDRLICTSTAGITSRECFLNGKNLL